MPNYIVLGAQWGDEGKGKIVNILSGSMDLVIRCQGGANAGHTVNIRGNELVLHILPSGILNRQCMNIVGNGCVVDIIALRNEIEHFRSRGIHISPENLLVSQNAHVVTAVHKFMDSILGSSIGTTGRGIGPCYAEKAARTGIRMHDISDQTMENKYINLALHYKEMCEKIYKQDFFDIEASLTELKSAGSFIKPFIYDAQQVIYDAVKGGQNVLVEGAQGAMLDVDHGTYPYVTSSNTSIGGAFTGTGVFMEFEKRIAVVKAYATRVGNGPFPTEQNNETGEMLRKIGNEYGATTGRPRRCGWIDLVLLKKTCVMNGYNYIALTKIDCLGGFDIIKACTGYDDSGSPVYKEFAGWEVIFSKEEDYESLPGKMKTYIDFIENFLEVPVGLISTGPQSHDLIFKIPLVSRQ